MRKRLITPIRQDAPPRDQGWLDLDGAGVVEVTSEEKAGLLMADARLETLCGSSGILVPRRQYARWRNIRLNSRMSPFLNWSLCLTKVEEWLTPPSRVCACLDCSA